MLLEANDAAEATIRNITDWAIARSDIQIVLLTGSLVNPYSKVDAYSDYDVILVVDRIEPYADDQGWINDFGEVLVPYWDPVYRDETCDMRVTGNVIQYKNGLKIDFSVWPVGMIERLTEAGELTAELDMGYRVLLDKTGAAKKLKTPTYRSHVPQKPSTELFRKTVADFFSDAPYVAKCLLRDELLPAKWCLDYDMRDVFLRPMLEWLVQTDHGWSMPVGALGKGLKSRLSPEIWKRLEASCAGADLEDNWKSLFAMMELFGLAASAVAADLGYIYPQRLQDDVAGFVMEMKANDKLLQPPPAKRPPDEDLES